MDSLTDIPGIRVGHATDPTGSGCTVVLGPFRAAVEVRGMATGTRELGPLLPEHLVDRVDALFFSGGSAFGLSVGDGVSKWLEARGEGFRTPGGIVPIVSGAVLYDLAEGRARPDASFGWRACEEAASGPVAMGVVGAGAGATSGKAMGPECAGPGGIGSASEGFGSDRVGALVALNPFGDVVDGAGHPISGPRSPEGGFVDSERWIVEDGGESGAGSSGTNTTLAVVATDVPLGAVDLIRLARMASTALARRIRPVHTPLDGDLIFAVSTGGERAEHAESIPLDRLMRLGVLSTRALERSIDRAVVAAEDPRTGGS